jgi:hypothetical protein
VWYAGYLIKQAAGEARLFRFLKAHGTAPVPPWMTRMPATAEQMAQVRKVMFSKMLRPVPSAVKSMQGYFKRLGFDPSPDEKSINEFQKMVADGERRSELS